MDKPTPITELDKFFQPQAAKRQHSVIAMRPGETAEQAAKRAAQIKAKIAAQGARA